MKEALLNFVNQQFSLAIDANINYYFIEVRAEDWQAFLNERGLSDLDLCDEINIAFKDEIDTTKPILSAYTRQERESKFYGIALLKSAFPDQLQNVEE